MSSKKINWLPCRRKGNSIAHFNKPLPNVHTEHPFEQNLLHQKICLIRGVLSTLLPTSSQEGALVIHYQQSRGRGSSSPTDANQQGERNTTEKGHTNLHLGANKMLGSIGQSNLTITLVNYINPPSVCQDFCQFLSVVPTYPSSSNMYAILDCRRRLPLDWTQEEEQQFASNLVATLRHSG